jgi:hypothetical protein
MCIAIFQPEGKKINKEDFLDYANKSPDGFGMLWVEDKVLKRFVTLNKNDFYDKYQTICNLYNNVTPMVIHFRNGRPVIIENCHAFFVIDGQLGFVHNGFIPKMKTDDKYSDTYRFNEDILRPLGKELYNTNTFQLITSLVGKYNKLIFLNKNKKYFIINEKEGVWKDGIWYSNLVTNYGGRSNYGCNYTKVCVMCEKNLLLGVEKYFAIMKPNYDHVYICVNCGKKDYKFSEIIVK